MNQPPLRAAIVGCGVIADSYFRDLQQHPEVIVTGCYDLDLDRAQASAEKYGGHVFPDLDELLASENVDLVINLTIFQAHYEVTRRCLDAGKHVFSEKPLTTRYEDAKALVDLAAAKNVRLGCAPFTFLGEAQQTAAQLIRSGRLGDVRVAYAEVNWGRIETWHPAPVPFYEIGPLYDVGVYPLAILASIFGPAQRVWAYGRVLQPDRTTKRGVPYRVETPDFGVTLVEYASGPVARLTTNFYVTQQTKQTGIEFHGDVASLYLSHWHSFRADVSVADFNQPYEPAPYLQEPAEAMDWGLGVADMARAIAAGEPHRASGELTSTFAPPAPMPWATPPGRPERDRIKRGGFETRPYQPGATLPPDASPAVLVVAGSLMPQTRARLAHLHGGGLPAFALDTSRLFDAAERETETARLTQALIDLLGSGQDAVLHAPNEPDEVAAARRLGGEHGLGPTALGRLVSATLADVNRRVVQASGVRRLVIAGGETSAAVAQRLDITGLRIWKEIQPGLPSCLTLTTPPLLLVLKSGSFGSADFLAQAIAYVREP